MAMIKVACERLNGVSKGGVTQYQQPQFVARTPIEIILFSDSESPLSFNSICCGHYQTEQGLCGLTEEGKKECIFYKIKEIKYQ